MSLKTLDRKKELQNKGNFIRKISRETSLPEHKVRYYTAVMLENYYRLKTHRAGKKIKCSKCHKMHRDKLRIMRVKNLLKKELQLT